MQNLPDLLPGCIQLLLAPNLLRRNLATHFAVQLALRGPLRILDGGNRFDLSGTARELRRQTRRYHAALVRICVARAFTCYQMTALLSETKPQPISTLVTDLLSTFQDEDVAIDERRRLLELGIEYLQRLSQCAIVLVSADPQTPEFLEPLMAISGQIWQFKLPEIPQQTRLL